MKELKRYVVTFVVMYLWGLFSLYMSGCNIFKLNYTTYLFIGSLPAIGAFYAATADWSDV